MKCFMKLDDLVIEANDSGRNLLLIITPFTSSQELNAVVGCTFTVVSLNLLTVEQFLSGNIKIEQRQCEILPAFLVGLQPLVYEVSGTCWVHPMAVLRCHTLCYSKGYFPVPRGSHMFIPPEFAW